MSKCSSIMKSKRIGWVGHVDCMEQITSTYTILFGKLEVKSPLGRSRHEREDSIKRYYESSSHCVDALPVNTEGAKKMYTHFKRCYLCITCIHFFGTLCILTCNTWRLCYLVILGN